MFELFYACFLAGVPIACEQLGDTSQFFQYELNVASQVGPNDCSDVVVYVTDNARVAAECGTGRAACYWPQTRRIWASIERGQNLGQDVLHEFAHCTTGERTHTKKYLQAQQRFLKLYYGGHE